MVVTHRVTTIVSCPNKYLDICLLILKGPIGEKYVKNEISIFFNLCLWKLPKNCTESVSQRTIWWINVVFKAKKFTVFTISWNRGWKISILFLCTCIGTQRQEKVHGALMLVQNLSLLKAFSSTNRCYPGCHRYLPLPATFISKVTARQKIRNIEISLYYYNILSCNVVLNEYTRVSYQEKSW